MAVKKTTEKAEEKKVNYKEFKYTGKVFEYTGRIFPGRDGSGKIRRRWGLTLTLNGVLDIKGCTLTETDSNVFISWPQYHNETKKEWVSYIYVNKDLNDELDGLVNELMKVVGISGEDVAKASEKTEELPF